MLLTLGLSMLSLTAGFFACFAGFGLRFGLCFGFGLGCGHGFGRCLCLGLGLDLGLGLGADFGRLLSCAGPRRNGQ